MRRIGSKLIHGNLELDRKNEHRSLKTPIYDTAAYDFESAEAIEDAFMGNSDAFIYSRITNPTVRELEERLKQFANAENCLAVSSGMAAISNVILTLCESGDNIVTSKYLFGNTYSLFTKTIKSFGIEVRFVDLDNITEIEQSIDAKTRGIFLEILTNPQLKIYDFEKIAEFANQKNVILIVDNSILTPYVFQSSKYKVDVEVLSTTKFISGGATSVGGAVFTFPSEKWASIPKLQAEYEKFGNQAFFKKLSKEMFRNLGSCQSPNNAYLQLLGLETLTIRVERISQNALETAIWLQSLSQVKKVVYSQIPSADNFSMAQKYFGNMSGCLVGVELHSKNTCYTFMNELKMIRRGTNFCDNKSLVIHPASTIFCDFTETERIEMQINDRQLRLAVGLEHIDDIKSDILQALQKVQ